MINMSEDLYLIEMKYHTCCTVEQSVIIIPVIQSQFDVQRKICAVVDFNSDFPQTFWILCDDGSIDLGTMSAGN